ncbi:MAG: hypothetical protein ACYDEV_04415 [Acidiferrobacter sp.]
MTETQAINGSEQTVAWQAAEIFSASSDQAQTPSLKLLAMSLMSGVDEFSANAWAGAVMMVVEDIPSLIERLEDREADTEARRGAIQKLQEIHAAYLADPTQFLYDMSDWADPAWTAERAANIAHCGVGGDDDEADES